MVGQRLNCGSRVTVELWFIRWWVNSPVRTNRRIRRNLSGEGYLTGGAGNVGM